MPFSFEIQENGNFLLVSLDYSPDKAVCERVAELVGQVVPGRVGDDSWMVVVIQAGEVVDSYSGGNLQEFA
ncbi:hypothetical protein ACXZ1M_14500 [Duganella sp. PWIR1]